MPKRLPLNLAKGRKSSIPGVPLDARCVSLSSTRGSCTNVAFTTLIDKLQVLTKVHPTPYMLQWLKKGNEVTVSKQDLISFSVGSFCGEVLCYVLPMNACHILLGRR